MTAQPITRAWRVRLVLGVLLLAGLCPRPAAADIVYHYDELGRLRAVIDASGESAEYVYDAVGNILQIIRRTAGTVSIIEFTPKRGPTSTSVTIFGTGYSATPSQNAVTFNGVAATVTSASTTQLVVTVPPSATTGTIGITVAGGGSATSGEPFTVTATSGAPTITNLAPTIGLPGTPGTTVTITGTNFETVAANNRVAFNTDVTRGRVNTATATSLSTYVPPKGTSGRISVATPAGAAISSQDFFVPPSPYTPADVVYTGRTSIGSAVTVSIPTATKIGLLLFDGTAGQRISFVPSGVTIGLAYLTVYAPNGSVLVPQFSISPYGGFMDVTTLPTTGTYQILIDPNGMGPLELVAAEISDAGQQRGHSGRRQDRLRWWYLPYTRGSPNPREGSGQDLGATAQSTHAAEHNAPGLHTSGRRLEVEWLGDAMETEVSGHSNPERRTRLSLWARTTVFIGLGLLLAMFENWMLWGFFVSRPTLAAELEDGDRLVAFSMLDFRSGPASLALSERTAAAADAAAFCYVPLNECREGRLVLRLQQLYGGTGTIVDVGQSSLKAAWAELTRAGWLPKASNPAYEGTAVPVAGLAILFRKSSNREHLLFAYRTSEIANDRYAYSEALFQVTGSGATLIKQIHFFLDIAGMEGIKWPILWPANVIILFLAPFSIDRLRRTTRKILQRRISGRPSPPQGVAPSG